MKTKEQQESIEDFLNVMKLLQELNKMKDEYERRTYNFDITEITKVAKEAETTEAVEETRVISRERADWRTRSQQIERIFGQTNSGYYFGTNTYERKFYTGDYYGWYNIPEYYTYTFTVNRTYVCGSGDTAHGSGKFSGRYSVTQCHVEGLKSPIQDFIKGYLKETYDWYYDQFTLWVNATYNPDNWDSYFQFESWRSQAIQLRLKFYEEFVTAGCGDPSNPNPSWTWGNFTDSLGVNFDFRATCPQTWALKETYNEGWGIEHKFDLPYLPIATSPQDNNIITFGGGWITFLLDAEAKYDLGLIQISGEKFCFMPSVDANGNWMPDTISFDYVSYAYGSYIGNRNTTPYLTTSERFYLCDLYDGSNFANIWYDSDQIFFLKRFYTIREFETYNAYWKKLIRWTEPWDYFLAEYPAYDWVDTDRQRQMRNEYLKNHFSFDYIASAAERWTIESEGSTASDPSDPAELAKIKQMLEKANSHYLDFWQ